MRWFGEKDEEACNYSEGSLFHVGSDYHLSQRLSAVCQVCICSSVILQHNLQLLHVWDKNRVWRVCQGEVDALLGDSLPLAYSYFTHIMNNNVKADLNFSGSSGLWKAIIRPQVGSCSYFLKSAILNCIHTNYILSVSILTVVIDQCLMLNTPPTSAREHSWTDRWTDLFRKWFASVCSPQLTFNKALTNSTTLVTIIISQHLTYDIECCRDDVFFNWIFGLWQKIISVTQAQAYDIYIFFVQRGNSHVCTSLLWFSEAKI